MANFICPVCSQQLTVKEKSYICKNRHTFDISSKGYVNLLPANKKGEFNIFNHSLFKCMLVLLY